jgi:CMP-N-acetylneuraminic acid synthetase
MYKNKKIVAFVPAKSKSERFENKNQRVIQGRPLFMHAVSKLLSCDIIDRVVLDSDSDTILNQYEHLGYTKMKRCDSLANNSVDGNRLLLNEAKQYQGDIYVQLLCTAPLITVESIEKAIKTVIDYQEFDSAVAVNVKKIYTWNNNKPNYDICNIPNSKDLEEIVSENMSLYVIHHEALHTLKTRVGKKPFLMKLDNIQSIDIDNEEDFDTARSIMLGQSMDEVSKLSKLKCVLTSELLSDALSEMGFHNQVISLNTNLKNNKSIGRAKTLKIKPIENDNPNKIYDTMEYYEYIVPNDILCIENNLDAAFFGEINAMIATSKGASSAIVSKTTRDIKEVTSMNFPVYYESNKCSDVKFKGVLDHYDKPISIKGVSISPGDLIFCDHEGIVVIPSDIEEESIKVAMESFLSEKKIIYDFASGLDIIDRKF